MAENITFGLAADFENPHTLMKAAKRCRDKGFKSWDVITPFPVHGLEEAMGLKRSRVPFFTFIGGATGFITGTFIAWYMNAFDYPLIVGGKPLFSPVFPFPVMYELTILLAALSTIAGMFILNGLPRHYHPVMKAKDFAATTDDTLRITIESSDPLYDSEKTRVFLQEIGGTNIQELED
ncbi:MAG: hypothetical protein CMI18_13530 [Opitutaceae bacterium]|nr:hypothetical protein [Opitutaceae bacterium]|tara:strand:- start:3539 stop:4075 length:537 start_codon:yes stop_codon:yes gene_type:complete